MKRILMLATFGFSLIGHAVFAQSPDCTLNFASGIGYHYGEYVLNKNKDNCVLMRGEGVAINFIRASEMNMASIRKSSNNISSGGKYLILETVDFSSNSSVIQASASGGSSSRGTQDIPQWVQKWTTLHRDDFAKYAPNHLPAIDNLVAEKQKVLDAENAKIAQEKSVADKLAQEKRQAQDALDTAKLRTDIAKMNAGQLFAKADELSSSGDTAKAREVLRALVSRFPDHPLAAQAAAQMAGMNSNQNNAANNGANNGNGANASSNNGGVSNVSVPSVGGGKCWDVMAKREKDYEAIIRRAVPAGATPPFMRVMWITADSIKIIDTYCAGDAKAAKYRGELQLAYNQSKTACEQLSAGQCQPNPY